MAFEVFVDWAHVVRRSGELLLTAEKQIGDPYNDPGWLVGANGKSDGVVDEVQCL